jgi:hypothetical protein
MADRENTNLQPSQSGSKTVLLSGGPFDGQRVPRPSDRSLLVEMPDSEMVARYRQSRDRDVFRFREYDRVVVRVAMPRG